MEIIFQLNNFCELKQFVARKEGTEQNRTERGLQERSFEWTQKTLILRGPKTGNKKCLQLYAYYCFDVPT